MVQSVTILWLLFLILELVSFSPDDLLVNIRINLICLNFIAPFWVIAKLFLRERLSKKTLWLTSAILVLPVVLSAPLLLPESSTLFKLYIVDFIPNGRIYNLYLGPLETATSFYSAGCVFICFCSLLGYFKENISIKLTEKIAALFIMWTPIAAHFLGIYFKAQFDYKPLTLSLWGVITVYLASQRQFFNAAPSLVWNIFDVTKEGIAVISMDGSVNVNKAFVEAFGHRSDDFFDFADELYAGLSKHINQGQEIIGLEAEKDGVYYEISVKNLTGRKNRVIGQLITFNDVSETKHLTLAKERARISSGLHDSMGNRLIALINNQNLALMQPTLQEARPFVDTAVVSATASLMTLRKIVEGLSPVDYQATKLISLIESVINRISASGTCVDLQISGDPEELPIPHKEFVYITCQEALTNSLIHGKAENVIIKLECTAGMLKMDIVDNGQGCKEISKNNGLANMEIRADELGGKISFDAPPFGGFAIYTEIPIMAGERV